MSEAAGPETEALNPEEIEALLKGVNDGAVPLEPLAAPPGEARSCDPSTLGRVVRGRMPTLETINDRFARQLRGNLQGIVRCQPDVATRPVKILRFGEYIQGLPLPTSLNLVKFPPLRGLGLFVLDASLVFALVERFFGGSGRYTKVEGRDFTRSESRVIQIVLKQAFDDLREAWAPVAKIEVEYQNSEFNPQFVNVVSASELIVVTTFHVELEGGGGELHIAMPYSMLEPLRDVLGSPMQGDPTERDLSWTRTIREEIEEAEIEIVPLVGRSTVTVGRLLNMKPGDVIPCDFTGSITLLAEGIPVLRGQYGASRGHQSVKVDGPPVRNRP